MPSSPPPSMGVPELVGLRGLRVGFARELILYLKSTKCAVYSSGLRTTTISYLPHISPTLSLSCVWWTRIDKDSHCVFTHA